MLVVIGDPSLKGTILTSCLLFSVRCCAGWTVPEVLPARAGEPGARFNCRTLAGRMPGRFLSHAQRLTRRAGIKRIIAPPTATRAANRYRLAAVLCVRSVIQPTTKVLVKPAMLPSELTSAMPAAAAAPLRKAAGRLQNAACALDAPAAAKVSPTRAVAVL